MQNNKRTVSLVNVVLSPFTTILSWYNSSVGTLQMSCFVMLLLTSVSVAFAGLATLLLLAASRVFTPPSLSVAAPLFFDYSGPVAVAAAALSPALQPLQPWLCPAQPPPLPVQDPGTATNGNGGAVKVGSDTVVGWPEINAGVAGLPPGVRVDQEFIKKNRVLLPGQKVAVWAELTVPADFADLFQLTCELVAFDGMVVARSARSWVAAPALPLERSIKQLLLAPLSLLGLYRHERVIRLHMLDAYSERQELPLAFVRTQLAGRTNGHTAAPPPVIRSRVDVVLRLSPVKRLLFMIRPGLVMTVLLGALGGSLLAGGSTAAGLLILGYMIWSAWSRSGGASKTYDPELRVLDVTRLATPHAPLHLAGAAPSTPHLFSSQSQQLSSLAAVSGATALGRPDVDVKAEPGVEGGSPATPSLTEPPPAAVDDDTAAADDKYRVVKRRGFKFPA